MRGAVALLPYLLLLCASCALRAAFGVPRRPPAALELWLGSSASTLSYALGALAGAAVAAALLGLVRAASRFPAVRALRLELARGLPTDRALLLGTVLLGPVAEEVFFRGLVQPWVGLGCTALAFAVVHVRRRANPWLHPLAACGFALVAGALADATGSLVAPITAHVLVNAGAVWSVPRTPRKRALGGLLS
jgi:membrane protease YdiL (CAAX protease family)